MGKTVQSHPIWDILYGFCVYINELSVININLNTKLNKKMKKLSLIFVALMLFGLVTKAQNTWTVDNNANSGAQFTSLQAAIDDENVVDGDILLVSGSATSYGSIILNKSLKLIGPGHHPQKDIPVTAKISSISLKVKIINFIDTVSNTDNSSIDGFEINGMLRDYYGANNIIIKNNSFVFDNFIVIDLNENSNNFLIMSNYIIGYGAWYVFGIYNASNIHILNNIIRHNSTIVYHSNSSTVTISNNIFLYGFSCNTITNALFTNNIFYTGSGSWIDFSGVINCTLNNNISQIDLPTGTNNGSNNLNLPYPMFINVPINDHDFSWSYNYQLSETSPGHNAGTDGTDIGPFGGAYPISTTGEPKLPIIELFNINNPIIPLDSVLNIHIKVSNH